LAQWCGKKAGCQHKTKSGGCNFIHYGCPYGPRASKPEPGEYVEDLKAEEKRKEAQK